MLERVQLPSSELDANESGKVEENKTTKKSDKEKEPRAEDFIHSAYLPDANHVKISEQTAAAFEAQRARRSRLERGGFSLAPFQGQDSCTRRRRAQLISKRPPISATGRLEEIRRDRTGVFRHRKWPDGPPPSFIWTPRPFRGP